jgi:hypothetical protein
MNTMRTLALAAGLALLAGCTVAAHSGTRPHVHLDGSHPAVVVTGCATEDSCTARYAHGQWTIRRVTP